jgi:hypothetical protein
LIIWMFLSLDSFSTPIFLWRSPSSHFFFSICL